MIARALLSDIVSSFVYSLHALTYCRLSFLNVLALIDVCVLEILYPAMSIIGTPLSNFLFDSFLFRSSSIEKSFTIPLVRLICRPSSLSRYLDMDLIAAFAPLMLGVSSRMSSIYVAHLVTSLMRFPLLTDPDL